MLFSGRYWRGPIFMGGPVVENDASGQKGIDMAKLFGPLFLYRPLRGQAHEEAGTGQPRK
ncbi:hypothetical protein BC89_24190 [Pseudomonas monteilii]|nr:hypothetical protein BC89_24190 [Pseudomonas monteilii]